MVVAVVVVGGGGGVGVAVKLLLINQHNGMTLLKFAKHCWK